MSCAVAETKPEASAVCFVCRALRQNKEAAALGLLEGHAQQGSRDKDIEVLYPASLLFCAMHMPDGMTK